VNDKVELKFVIDLVGHDESTIRQMYNDWLGNKPDPQIEILLNKFDDFNNEENIVEPFTEEYYKMKKWLVENLIQEGK